LIAGVIAESVIKLELVLLNVFSEINFQSL